MSAILFCYATTFGSIKITINGNLSPDAVIVTTAAALLESSVDDKNMNSFLFCHLITFFDVSNDVKRLGV